jgi:hypothetical protein
MADGTPASTIQLIGAGCFGAILGWYLYYVNRYRSGTVDFGDVTTIATTIGGAAVLALFPSGTDMFGAYGIGLAIGFFGYYLALNTMVARSQNFDADFFLDGRRKRPTEPFYIPEEWRAAISSGMDATYRVGQPPAYPTPNAPPPAGPQPPPGPR